ncbi:MAG TPA: 50S ribosomal protein L25 [Candidatus Saccharimonadia bacterium]
MADKITIQLQSRDSVRKTNRNLRKSGNTPAIMYGHGSKAIAVTVLAKELEQVYAQAGGNRIVSLKLDDGKLNNALIHDVQLDSRTGHIIHADFFLIRMDEKIKAEIPLHVIGESTAVYQQEGTLTRPIETVEVEALPADLPESIEVDISVLDDFDKNITIGDLKFPANVEVLTPPETLVATVVAPRSDEELEELDAAVESELPEGVAEDQEVIVEDSEQTRKEPENRSDKSQN